MDFAFTVFLYGIAGVSLMISFFKNRKKTWLSLKRAGKMFASVLPQFAAILLITGMLLQMLGPGTIRQVMGTGSGFGGMAVSALLGSVALVPVLIAFPIAAELLKNGAGIAQIAVFISTLTTVGFVTLPMEMKYLGKKAALLRNILAFIFSFATACVMGAVLL